MSPITASNNCRLELIALREIIYIWPRVQVLHQAVSKAKLRGIRVKDQAKFERDRIETRISGSRIAKINQNCATIAFNQDIAAVQVTMNAALGHLYLLLFEDSKVVQAEFNDHLLSIVVVNHTRADIPDRHHVGARCLGPSVKACSNVFYDCRPNIWLLGKPLKQGLSVRIR
jgi:hypothetical protein